MGWGLSHGNRRRNRRLEPGHNTPDFSTDGSTAASPAVAPASPQGQAVSSSLPLDYDVRFTLADGDVVTVNGGQLFALEGFSFSEQG